MKVLDKDGEELSYSDVMLTMAASLVEDGHRALDDAEGRSADVQFCAHEFASVCYVVAEQLRELDSWKDEKVREHFALCACHD